MKFFPGKNMRRKNAVSESIDSLKVIFSLANDSAMLFVPFDVSFSHSNFFKEPTFEGILLKMNFIMQCCGSNVRFLKLVIPIADRYKFAFMWAVFLSALCSCSVVVYVGSPVDGFIEIDLLL